MKKLIASLLVVIMTMMCLAGCGGSGDNEEVELIWASVVYESKEYETVIKVFNEKLQEFLPNTKVTFKKVTAENWPLWMTGGEQVDIAWAGYLFDPLAEVKKGSYLALDDLIAEYGPNIKKEMEEEYATDYANGNYEGKQYLIPNQQARFDQTGSIIIPASLWKYMDVDALRAALDESPYLTEKQLQIIDDYLEKVFASSDYDTDVIAKYMDVASLGVLAERGYDSIAGYMYYKAFEENPEIVHFGETDEFKLFAKYATKWYEKGYISSEVLTGGGIGSRTAVISYSQTNDWHATTVEGMGEERGVVYGFNEVGDITTYKILTESVNQMYNGVAEFAADSTYLTIPYTAKHPERAMQLLDLLRSPEGQELFTLLVYGFEKDSELAKDYNTYHYELTEDGMAQGVDYTVQPNATSKYGMAGWMVGNCLLTYLTPDLAPGADEYIRDFKKNVEPTLHATKYAGFMSDNSEISTDLANLKATYAEYSKRISTGAAGADMETLYNEMITRLKECHLEEVKQNLQKQADEFASTQ